MLALKPNDVIAVGDEPRDIESARASGVLSVGTTWGTTDEPALLASQPDFVAASVAT